MASPHAAAPSPDASRGNRAAPEALEAGAVREVLEALGAAAHAHVRAGFAAGSDAPAVAQASAPWLTPATAQLIARRHTASLVALAANPVCPPDLLHRLADDDARLIADAATRNPTCPYDVVETFGDYHALLTHPDCPVDVLEDVLTDRYERRHVLAHPTLPRTALDPIWAELSGLELTFLLPRPDLSHDEALTLIARAADTDGRDDTLHREARRLWAGHPHADPAWLAVQVEHAWAQHQAGRYRAVNEALMSMAATNPATPADAVALVARTGTPPAVTALAHAGCPPDAMHAALDTLPGLDTPARAAAAPGPDPVAVAVANNPAAPRDVLARLTPDHLMYTGRRDSASLLAFAYAHATAAMFTFVHAHATSGPHATTLLMLFPSWTSSLGELLDTADAVLAPA